MPPGCTYWTGLSVARANLSSVNLSDVVYNIIKIRTKLGIMIHQCRCQRGSVITGQGVRINRIEPY